MADQIRDRKSGRFVRQPDKHFWNKLKSIFHALLPLTVLLVLLYGILTKRDIHLSLVGGFPAVSATERHKEVEGQDRQNSKDKSPSILGKEVKTVGKELYDEVLRKNKELEKTIQELERTIQKLQGELGLDRNSVWHCCSVIAGEISQTLSIDTNLNSLDDHTKEIYRCIQRLLNAIRYYDGLIDGDQGRTQDTLEEFQQAMGLTVDGKLGKQTWRVMLIMLGREISGEVKTK